MTFETKTVSARFDTKVDGAPAGTVRAIVSVFGNEDKGGDIVMPGAFTESLAALKATGGTLMPFIWSHQWEDPTAYVGAVTDAKETPDGLEVTAQFNMDDPHSQRVYELLATKMVANFSFGYEVLESQWVQVEDSKWGEVRQLTKLNIFECGPCLRGMNPDTRTLEVASEKPPTTVGKTEPETDNDAPGDTSGGLATERLTELLTTTRHSGV